jgi:hypothetical protein
VSGPGPPKLSLHESGRVHVQLGGAKSEPVFLSPLSTYRGEHIATIQPDRLEVLPPHMGRLLGGGRERDFVLPLDEQSTSGAIAVYVTAGGPPTVEQSSVLVRLDRSSLPGPLFAEFRPKTKQPLGAGGMIVLSGFHPREARDPFLYAYGRSTKRFPWAVVMPRTTA